MKYPVIIFLLFGVLFLFTVATQAVDWRYDFTDALKKAEASQKPIMADFYTEWCGWCKKLDSDTYSDRTINELAGKFVCVKIDADKNRDLAARYNVMGYPTIIFFNSKGVEQQRIIGYLDAKNFTQIMTNVAEKAPKVPSAQAAEGKAKKVEFKLGGIIYTSNTHKAIINDTIVCVGDSVEGAKVTKITEDEVVLSKNGKMISLSMKE